MWKISQVEALTGLPRRDIQRVCEPNGNVSIISPEDSKHGRRFFNREELLEIYLIKQFKDMGYNLKQIQGLFQSADNGDRRVEDLLDLQIAELEAKRAMLDEQLVRVKEYRFLLETTTADTACAMLLMRRYFKAISGALDGFVESILPPEEHMAAKAELRDEFDRIYGINFDELAQLSVADLEDRLPDSVKPASDQDLVEYAERVRELVSKKADPASAEARLTVEKTLQIIGANPKPQSEEDLSPITALLIISEAMGETDFILPLEMLIGAGSSTFLKQAIGSYLKHWLDKRTSEEGDGE